MGRGELRLSNAPRRSSHDHQSGGLEQIVCSIAAGNKREEEGEEEDGEGEEEKAVEEKERDRGERDLLMVVI